MDVIGAEAGAPNDNKREKLEYRMKIGMVFILSVLDGLVESSYGPSVKDYQCIFQETRQRISLLYPIFATFKAIGTLVYYPLQNRVDDYLVGVVCMEITCLLLVTLPLLPYLWIALLLTSVIGLAGGISSHARLVECGKLAKDSAVPIHMFPLGMCTGSFIGPLVISPFLGDNGSSSCHGNQSQCDNNTLPTVNYSINSTASYECDNFNSNIVFGFLIFVAFGTLVCIAYTPLRKILRSEKDEKVESGVTPSKTIEKIDIIFLVFLAIIIAIGGPTNFIYGNMLSTFGINSSLSVSPQLMAIMTSSFFATTLIGRIIGTCATLILSQQVLVTACLIGSIAAGISLIFLAEVSVPSLWVTTCVLAFMYSPLFGAVIAWSGDVCRTKHIVYGLIMIANLCGNGLMTFLIGQMMNNVDVKYLNYIMLGICIMQIAIFCVLIVISKLSAAKERKQIFRENSAALRMN